MHRSRSFVPIAAAIVALCASGCGRSPTAPAPEEPPVEARTPVGATIAQIDVTKFPALRTDGSSWDPSPIVAERRPDLYVTLEVPGEARDYQSGVQLNARSEDVQTFVYGVRDLPVTIPYDNQRRIYLYDLDLGNADDRLGWITVNLPKVHQSDDAPNFDYTFTNTSGRISVRIIGWWTY